MLRVYLWKIGNIWFGVFSVSTTKDVEYVRPYISTA